MTVKPGLPRRLRVRGVGLWNGQISVGSVQRSCTIANASFQDIFPEANTSLSVYANEASSYASKLASSAKSTVSDQLNSLPDMSMLLDEQVSKLPELTNSLRDNASDTFSAVSDMARAVVGASQDALQEAMPRVSAQVAEVLETLSTGSLDAILASPPTVTAGGITAVALVSLVGFAAGSSSSSSSSDFGAASRSRESSSGSSQARAAPFSQSTTPVSESSLRTQSVSIGQAQSSTREGAAVSMAAAPTRAAVATVEPPFSTRAVANAATNGAVHNAAEANFSAYTQETNESNKEPVLPVVVGDGNADTDGSLKRAPDGDSKTESSAEAGTNATGKVATAAMAEPVVESVTASEVPAEAVDTSPASAESRSTSADAAGVSGQPAEKVAPVTTASDVLDAEQEQVAGAVADEVKRGDIKEASEAESAAPPVGTAGPASTDGSVALRYASGWAEAQIHASINGQEWGVWELARDGDFLTWAAEVGADAEGPLLEFVLTDKQGDWDKPPSGENYVIFEHGTYVLKDGQLQQEEITEA